MTAAWRFYFLMSVRAWKATAPDLTGHRPQIAGNRNADRIARHSPSLQSHNPARRHAAAARPPRWCAVGAARLRAGTAARLRVAAPYCALAAARGRLRGTLRHTTSDPLSCTIHG